ncbi:centromere protein L-like [Phymastichus coffea]|uniref:centromere protein L-like n=1 Tax=Phymastichus coffea TaxID=108790 RepID=UPI00273B4BBD|nr:centromere protein L-like [Phymastichus coffea]
MDSNQRSRDSSRTTALLSRTAGIREFRRYFSLVSRTLTPSPDEEHEDDPLLDLEVLLRQTWNIFGISALFDFKCDDEVRMKSYGKKLREEVAANLSNEDVSYEAKISVLEIKRPKETDHPIVQIEVQAKIMTRETQQKTLVYRGFLISWRTEPTDLLTENSTRLPLLLCRGTVRTMRAVHAILGRMFDCMIVSLPTNAEDLAWLLPIFISPGGGQDTIKEHHEALLEYSVPGLHKSECLHIRFLIKDLMELWKSVSDDKDRIDVEEIDEFHKILQQQVMEIGGVHLGLCLLHRIHLPSIVISESKMKIMNVETMNTILTYLNEKALECLHLNTSQLSTSK